MTGWVLRGGLCQNTCPEGQLLVFSQSACRSCGQGCRICRLTNPLVEYSLENITCTRCNDGQILAEGTCSQNCPNGTQRVVSPSGSVACITLTCSSLCHTCLSSTRCSKCHEVDPEDSKIGIFQTFNGECLKCTSQFGLVTNLSANSTVESCSEICGDSFWYHSSQDLKKKDPENVGG